MLGSSFCNTRMPQARWLRNLLMAKCCLEPKTGKETQDRPSAWNVCLVNKPSVSFYVLIQWPHKVFSHICWPDLVGQWHWSLSELQPTCILAPAGPGFNGSVWTNLFCRGGMRRLWLVLKTMTLPCQQVHRHHTPNPTLEGFTSYINNTGSSWDPARQLRFREHRLFCSSRAMTC